VTGLFLMVTGEEVVLVSYRPLYSDVAQVTFSRTLTEWLETVEAPEGVVPRFKRL